MNVAITNTASSKAFIFRVLKLPAAIKEYHLINYFSKYGQILSVHIVCLIFFLFIFLHFN